MTEQTERGSIRIQQVTAKTGPENPNRGIVNEAAKLSL